jgi:hypothetical protein
MGLRGLLRGPEPVLDRAPGPPVAVLWILETDNGRAWVWPSVDGYSGSETYYHWRATIWHNQMPGPPMEARYQASWQAMEASRAMIGGTPDDWRAV